MSDGASGTYFAYDSNMDVTDIRARCPDAVFLEVGTIKNFKFSINAQGYATIVADEGSLVHGTVWRISAADEQALDRYERVDMNLYSKATMDVRLAHDRRLEAMLYLATDERPGRSRPGYMANIVGAALALGFPASYVQELRAWSDLGT